MKLCVLFWFYKNFQTCEDNLKIFKINNPDITVYSLYGGESSEADKAEKSVKNYSESFYHSKIMESSEWKWRNGDLLIFDWYKNCGNYLCWDTIFIFQWDMLITGSLTCIFKNLKQNHSVLSGYRRFNEVKDWWYWANCKDVEYFRDEMSRKFNYNLEMYANLFIVICLPRIFFEKSADIYPINGFLEYKIPTLHKALNIPICEIENIKPLWASEPNVNPCKSETCLNAVGKDIPFSIIIKETFLKKRCGIFHPVRHRLKFKTIMLLMCFFRS
jgi:hypothetical protein